MADNTGRSDIPQDELDEEGEEVDVLFRAQMGVQNFLLGYWKHLLIFLGVILAGVYAYSSWIENVRDTQRGIQAQMAKTALDVPEQDQMALLGLAADSEEDVEAVKKAAERYEAIAKAGTGTGATMAWVDAAEMWERGGDDSRAKIAWKAAHDLGPEGILGWTTAANYASQLANEGDVDGAAAVYRAWADDPAKAGYTVERAVYELGQLYEGAGRFAESQTAYEEFKTRFPNSDLVARVDEASRRIRDAG